jgi:hypothetical protein
MTAVAVDNRERSSSVSLLRVPAGVLVIAGFVVVASRSHQVAAAAVVAMTALTLAVGHLFDTTTFDMLITAAALGFSFGRCERSRSAGRPGSASAYSPVSRWRSRSWPRRYWCAVSLVLSPSGRGADWQACDLGLPPSLR